MENLLDRIIEASVGKDEDGKAKSSITISDITYNDETEDSCENGVYSAFGPILNIQLRSGYICVDMTFKSYADPDLKTIWALLEKYGREVNAYTVDDPNIPLLSLTIVPMEFKGKYFSVASNPIFWTLQPLFPDAPIDTIRLLFEEDDFQFLEGEEFNLDEVNIAIEEEISKYDAEIERRAQKDKEREEYYAQREARLEESRRNRMQ